MYNAKEQLRDYCPHMYTVHKGITFLLPVQCAVVSRHKGEYVNTYICLAFEKCGNKKQNMEKGTFKHMLYGLLIIPLGPIHILRKH